MSIHELSVDLLSRVFDYLDRKSEAVLGSSASAFLLVLRSRRTEDDPGRRVTREAAAGAAVEGRLLGRVQRPRFMTPREKSECVALVSYPRSGNSMMRLLLERITGTVTGSDTRPDRALSRSLLKQGLKGEGVTDDRVWLVKTHWPERVGCARFTINRAILLVRNPFDAIDSYFNMAFTNSHEKRLTEEVYTSLGPLWDEMMRREVTVWAKFNNYWLTQGIPVLAVRYEDILAYPEEMLVRVISFLENMPVDAVRRSAPYMERVRAAIDRLRGARVGKSLCHFTQDQIDELCRLQGKALRAFGYDPRTQGFPDSMPMLPPLERCIKFATAPSAASVVVNQGRLIRASDDKFGRTVTKLRHSLTDVDRRPLPTI